VLVLAGVILVSGHGRIRSALRRSP